jgi:hypothetical protein
MADTQAAALVSSERDGVGAREATRMLETRDTKYLLFTLTTQGILQLENTVIKHH